MRTRTVATLLGITRINVWLGAATVCLTAIDGTAQPERPQISCLNNLTQIGHCFRFWADEHDGRFPFNVSTNSGGTFELRVPKSNGFDANPVPHFLVLTNTEALSTPLLLVCPQDRSKHAASFLTSVSLGNLTYQIHTTTNATPKNPNEILVICPVDGNVLYCNGKVKPGKGTKTKSDGHFELP